MNSSKVRISIFNRYKNGEGSAVIIFIFLMGICYIIYDSIPSKYTKLEESFGGFMNRSLVRFEYEKSPLHTIVYGGTGKRENIFFKTILKTILSPKPKPKPRPRSGKQFGKPRTKFVH